MTRVRTAVYEAYLTPLAAQAIRLNQAVKPSHLVQSSGLDLKNSQTVVSPHGKIPFILSLEIRTSFSLIRIDAGLGFAPSPRVMYPVRPLNAPMAPALLDEVTGRGVVISTAVIVDIVKIAYSVGEYAKQTLS